MATRVKADYDSDDGNTYSIETLDYIATAGSLTTGSSAQRIPIGFKTRHLNCHEVGGNRKFRIPVQPGNALWTTPAGASITVNGVSCVVTGHSGERRIGG